uniref:Uncharacterized protein n=1 Tax=Arundo donax TaxID=35708 RepID=A0A0A9GYE7_ARUDO
MHKHDLPCRMNVFSCWRLLN